MQQQRPILVDRTGAAVRRLRSFDSFPTLPSELHYFIARGQLNGSNECTRPDGLLKLWLTTRATRNNQLFGVKTAGWRVPSCGGTHGDRKTLFDLCDFSRSATPTTDEMVQTSDQVHLSHLHQLVLHDACAVRALLSKECCARRGSAHYCCLVCQFQHITLYGGGGARRMVFCVRVYPRL